MIPFHPRPLGRALSFFHAIEGEGIHRFALQFEVIEQLVLVLLQVVDHIQEEMPQDFGGNRIPWGFHLAGIEIVLAGLGE